MIMPGGQLPGTPNLIIKIAISNSCLAGSLGEAQNVHGIF
jgi:hypothetical protein